VGVEDKKQDPVKVENDSLSTDQAQTELADGQTAVLLAERNDYKDRWMRQLAELENFKKRAEREKVEFLYRANEAMAKDLLSVVDNLERALEHVQVSGENNTLPQGLLLTYQKLLKILGNYGLEKIEALGQPFNPEFHEAMLQQEDFQQDENIVLKELNKGYVFQGRLLRPTLVVVSKKPVSSNHEA